MCVPFAAALPVAAAASATAGAGAAVAGATSAAVAGAGAAAGGSFLSYASLGLTALGTGLKAFGAYQQAQSQKQMFAYQAAIQRNNSIYAGYLAKDALERGKIEESSYRTKVRQLIGRQRSIFGAAGVQLDSGTPLLVQEDTAEIGELDALTIRNNFVRESEAHLIRAQNFESNAGLSTAAASAVNPGLAVGTTLLTGAGSIAEKYNRFRFYKG